MISNTSCSDFGSKYCPCILAETGHCLVCNIVRGGSFCNCKGNHGFCIYEELKRNGGKAKPGRETIQAEVITKENYDGMVFIRVNVPYELEVSLKRPGSFVFIRTVDNPHFDIPVSVQYDENMVESIGMSIILRGPKSEMFRNIHVGDTIYLRGPYYSGIMGLRNLLACKESKSLVIAKGIGLLPSISAICHLRSNNNDIRVVVDPQGFSPSMLDIHLGLFEIEAHKKTVIRDGLLSEDIRNVIDSFLDDGGTFIHIGGSDFMIHLVTEYLSSIGRSDIKLSSCNNAKMCCGEGICGACSVDSELGSAMHLCKQQMDVRDIEIKKLAKLEK